ncbi:MAG: Flp family type IVb pilin [Acidimicrobiales bacterium]|nr:Flp family type IVb pilin [Acidimicrobiales bacterium]
MKDLSIRSAAAVQAWAVTLKDRTEGATAAEYALLVALIAVAIIVAVRVLGQSIAGVFEKTSSTLGGATS